MLITMSCQAPAQGTPGAIGGAVDGHVEVRFGVFHHDVGNTRQYQLNLAAFVGTTAGPIGVGKTNQHTLNLLIACAQGKSQATLYVVAQSFAE
jgi:hypothetical protein